MKSKRLLKLIVLISLVAVLAVGTPLMGGCRQAPPPVEAIKIGGLFERSGFVSMMGEDAYRATIVALEQVDYKVAGKPIDFIAEDVASDPTVTMDKARKLIETDKVPVITGMTLTAGYDAIGPYLTRMNIPTLATSGLTEKQALSGWPVWAHSGTCEQCTYTTGVYAYDVLGYRTVSTLGYDAEFARGYVDGFIEGFESRGGSIVQSQWVPLDILDFSPFIIRVADADAFAYNMIGEGTLSCTAQIREVGLWDRMPVIMPTDGELFDTAFSEQAGETSLGIVAHVGWSRYWDTPGNQEFIDAYTQRWGGIPGAYGAKAYTSAQVLLNALERTGGDVSFEALTKAFDETDMDTIRGRIAFTNRLGSVDNWIMKHVRMTEPKVEEVAIYRTKAIIVDDRIEISWERIK